jgi:transcriptional regulator with PAS, ATPase and Fis domain
MEGIMEAVGRRADELKQHTSLQTLTGTDALKKNVIGLDKGLKQVYAKVKAVAGYPVEVLLTGESGTGKELIAELIHAMSDRSERQLIAINCGAIPEGLFESELFGYTRGAFTGATDDKQGRIELADRSTLFLDELGELKPDAQVKLLRVLEARAVNRIGSRMKQASAVDFRLVAATNADLKKAVSENRFRSDLYYRVAKFVIELPPLRERQEDIMDLAAFFIAKYCRRFGKPLKKLEKAAAACLLTYDWPGNVRQLENEIENAIICSAERQSLGPDCFGFYKELKRPVCLNTVQAKVIFPDPAVLPHAREIRDLLLQEALRRTHNNQSEAARMIGIKHQAVSQRIKKFNNKFTN